MRLRNLAVAVILISAGLVMAQGLPDDVPNAERIRAYVKAFNAGDDAMTAFIKENVSEAALQRRNVEGRLAIYREMRDRMKSLEIKAVPNVNISGDEMAVTVRMK